MMKMIGWVKMNFLTPISFRAPRQSDAFFRGEMPRGHGHVRVAGDFEYGVRLGAYRAVCVHNGQALRGRGLPVGFRDALAVSPHLDVVRRGVGGHPDDLHAQARRAFRGEGREPAHVCVERDGAEGRDARVDLVQNPGLGDGGPQVALHHEAAHADVAREFGPFMVQHAPGFLDKYLGEDVGVNVDGAFEEIVRLGAHEDKPSGCE